MRISDWSSDVCSSDLFGCVALEQADLGPRRIIFGKPRDLLEQFRPPMIVEPPRRDRLLRLGKAGQHIGGEGGVAGPRPGRNRAHRLFASRRPVNCRSEEHTSELQSLMRISYAVF